MKFRKGCEVDMLLLRKEVFVKNLLAVFILLAGAALLVPFGAAKSADTPVTVAGKWHFVMDTEGGDRTIDAVFQQDGQQVTGKWGKEDLKGTFTDGKMLSLEFPVNSEEAGPGTLKIKGELAGDAIVGNWNFNDYTGTFKATRANE
jgi:hypothetical protein